mmetsp:Transcript_109140/g.314376  ORF Transcript_109140/g.314376 Transcript_109140/m.314376 type:complete len:203 (-) Transcript_109140:593-1201(-)
MAHACAGAGEPLPSPLGTNKRGAEAARAMAPPSRPTGGMQLSDKRSPSTCALCRNPSWRSRSMMRRSRVQSAWRKSEISKSSASERDRTTEPPGGAPQSSAPRAIAGKCEGTMGGNMKEPPQACIGNGGGAGIGARGGDNAVQHGYIGGNTLACVSASTPTISPVSGAEAEGPPGVAAATAELAKSDPSPAVAAVVGRGPLT